MDLFRRRWVWFLLAVWTGLMVAFYVWTVASGCSEEGQADGSDCGLTIGLGALMAIMIWIAGVVALVLLRGLVALVRRLTR